MTSITFPGPGFPGFPELSISCPEGWSPLPGVGYVLAVGLDGSGPDEYQPNTVVSVTRMPDGATRAEAIGHVISTLHTAPDSVEKGRDQIEVAGHPGFWMEASYTHPMVGAMLQSVRFAWVEHDGVVDMVQSIGACASHQADEAWDSIGRIQESLSIETV